ncbi:MAG: Crp/Fnr family transcriptional regulator [Pseudomonadota bacterium]
MKIRLGASNYSLSHAMSQTLKDSIRLLPRGTSLAHEGDQFASVIIVQDGWLSTEKSLENGARQLIDFVMPGDVLDPATANGPTVALSVSAITRVSLFIVPADLWRDLLTENQRVRDAVEHMRAAYRARVSERILRLGRGDARTRIAFALLEFCVRLDALGQSPNQSFHIPLTQAHIGDFVGLSAVHVSRVISGFKKAGIIETDDHLDIYITDLNALCHIAGIQAETLASEIRPVGT